MVKIQKGIYSKMKNILVTTDFSEHARNAAIYAASLARLTGARIVIFHAYRLPFILNHDLDETSSAISETDAQQKLDKLARELHQSYGVSVTRLLKPGFAEDELPALAKRLRADVVVTGCDKPLETQEFKPGTLETELIQRNNVAVLCVPDGVQYQESGHLTVMKGTAQDDNAFKFKVTGSITPEKAVNLLKAREENKIAAFSGELTTSTPEQLNELATIAENSIVDMPAGAEMLQPAKDKYTYDAPVLLLPPGDSYQL